MKDINKKLSVILMIFILAESCTNVVSPEKYTDAFEKKAKKRSYVVNKNGISISVLMIPSQFLAAQELTVDTTLDVTSLINKYDKSIYALITKCLILKKEDDSPENYYMKHTSDEIIENTFDKAKDISLVYCKDTIPAADCRYFRNWGIGKGESFLVAFNKRKMKYKLEKYKLVLRNMSVETGTITAPILYKNTNMKLRGSK